MSSNTWKASNFRPSRSTNEVFPTPIGRYPAIDLNFMPGSTPPWTRRGTDYTSKAETADLEGDGPMPGPLTLLGDRPARVGVAQVGGDLAKRLQHEPALPHPGVRQLQAPVPPPAIAEPQEIEVQRASRVRHGAHATAPVLDVEQYVEQLQRTKLRPGRDDHVQEPRGRGGVDRLGLPDGGDRGQLQSRRAQTVDARPEPRRTITQVAPQTDVGNHVFHPNRPSPARGPDRPHVESRGAHRYHSLFPGRT
jgi:hypothetical protein